MTDKQKKDDAVAKAGKIIVAAFPGHYGYVKYNLQGMRKSVHSNVMTIVEVEIVENQQPR